ncbi:hypothetical protein ACVQZ8_004564, partial [Escherichia coli]|uniref:hypothetical protein n=1 Tax=Escherichia coli TaxID=562 RepID=UPI001BC8A1BA
EESGFSIASMASDGFIHVFPVKKDKARTPERWRGIHNDNICLKLFRMYLVHCKGKAVFCSSTLS